ncbi:MAG: prolipoprotein diacylglyceryl transferase [Ferruginibacter sp.]|nr:prolipoprotein diacylglyceryl transferase [Cytophagales bacterium]
MFNFVVWDVSPVAVALGPFSVRWYGLLFAGGFWLSYRVLAHVFRREGRPEGDLDALAVYVVVATVVGARLGHFVFYEWDFLLDQPGRWLIKLVTPPFEGLASHGAGIVIFVALYHYARRNGQSYRWLLDRLAIGAALTGGAIRVGNLMNSEIVGKPTWLPWGFIFRQNPEFSPVPRHPAQLYEAIVCGLLFGLLLGWWSRTRERTPEGSLSGLFLLVVFSFRFLFEFQKENQAPFEEGLALNMGQMLSVPAVVVGVGLLVGAYRRKTH